MSIAVFTLIMQKRTTLHLGEITDSISIESTQLAQSQYGTNWSSSLSSVVQLEAAYRGMTDVFYVAAMTLFICIPLVLIFKKKKKPQAQETSDV